MSRKKTADLFLPSKGLNERQATLHTYVRSEVVTVVKKGANPVTGIAHYYKCSVTDAERRYGFDRTGFESTKEIDDVGTN